MDNSGDTLSGVRGGLVRSSRTIGAPAKVAAGYFALGLITLALFQDEAAAYLAVGMTSFVILLLLLFRTTPPMALALALPLKAFIDQFWEFSVSFDDFSVNSNMVVGALLPVMLALIYWPTVQKNFSWSIPNLCLVAFSVFSVADVLLATTLTSGVSEYVRAVSAIILLLTVGPLVQSSSGVRPILKGLFWVSLIILPGLVYSTIWQDGFFHTFGRYSTLKGPFHDKHTLAAFLMSGFIAGLALHRLRPRQKSFSPYLGVVIVLAGLIAITNSRATWIAAFLYVLAWALRHRRFVVLVLLLGAGVVVYPIAFERLSEAGIDPQSSEGVKLSGRTYIWAELITRFKYAPISEKLFGQGYGSSEVDLQDGNSQLRHNAHNMFLMLLTENGILIGGCFLLGLSGYVSRLFRRPDPYDPQRHELLVLREAAIGLVIFFFAAGITGHPYKYPGFAWPCYVALGAYGAYVRTPTASRSAVLRTANPQH